MSIFQPKLKIKNALFIYPHRTSASNHDLFSTLQGVKIDQLRSYSQAHPKIVNKTTPINCGFFGKSSKPLGDLPQSVKGRSVLLKHISDIQFKDTAC